MSKFVYLFLDEGGNFDFSANGTKFFTLTAVTKVRPFPGDGSLANLRFDLIEAGNEIHRFHATEDSQAVRDRVFGAIGRHLNLFKIDSLIVEKRKTCPPLREADQFYPRMLGYLIKFVLGKPPASTASQEVLVITDTIPLNKKRQAIEKAVKQTLSRELPAGVRYRVYHHPSMSCAGLQVADYCNWAIQRKWERNDSRSYDLIKSAIRSEFDIFRSGTVTYY
jgi:hypothetical protein